MPKTIVIHHSADFDGLFCREIARKFMPDAVLIGWDYGQPVPTPDVISADDKLYMLDISVDGLMGHPNLIWIDHHKSAIEKYPATIPGYRIDGVAACRLAWFWFVAWDKFKRQTSLDPDEPWFQAHYPFAAKQDFVDRKLEEPLAVRLAGEYDIWDKRDPDAETFQFALRSMELGSYHWDELLSVGLEELPGGERVTHSEAMVASLLKNGHLLQTYQQRNDAGMMHRSFIVEFEGLKFLALTTARCNSLTFMSKDVPETGHDALMGFYFDGKKWKFSLYHAKHNTGIDLSAIAVKFGGGGHRGACGFECDKIPFNNL